MKYNLRRLKSKAKCALEREKAYIYHEKWVWLNKLREEYRFGISVSFYWSFRHLNKNQIKRIINYKKQY